MKILIYMTGGFDTHGPSNHLFKALIEDLLLEKHEVRLIENVTTRKFPLIPDSLLNYNSFSYEYIETKPVLKSRFFQRYISMVKYAYKSKKLLKQHTDVDVVFVQSCATASFQVGFAKKKTKAKVIYNVQDMFPGSTIAVGKMPSKLMQKFFFWFQKKAYKKADIITCISEDMKEKLKEQGVPQNKIEVIPNWFEANVHYIDWKENLIVKKFNMDNKKFYIQFAGGMGYAFDYNIVIELAKRLKYHKNIIFQMIGDGSQKEKFIIEANNFDLKNIEFYQLQDSSLAMHVYSAASVCLVPLKEGVIGNSQPSKIGFILACGKPILAIIGKNNNLSQQIVENKIGYSFDYNDVDSIESTIRKLEESRNTLIQFKINNCKFAELNFDSKICLKKYKNVFEEAMR